MHSRLIPNNAFKKVLENIIFETTWSNFASFLIKDMRY